MILKDAVISLLVGSEKTTIELHDKTSGTMIAKVTLTPQELSEALSRVSRTSCIVEFTDYPELINKKLITAEHEFEMPDGNVKYEERESVAYDLAVKTCPEGWIPDRYFRSQGSFYNKNGKNMARCTIRKWE